MALRQWEKKQLFERIQIGKGRKAKRKSKDRKL
jgi:hypothetical protein